MLTHKKMNLFDAPELSILAHACNCRGSWGAGIALEFQKRFPKAHKTYQSACKEVNGQMAGGAILTDLENDHFVACLFTSNGYGKSVDPKDKILENTGHSVRLLLELSLNKGFPIYSNKFNSGLFRVPWEETEAIIKPLIDQYGVEWVVCEA
jgi:ADP-ribose 1''-phosphate phosphatase